MASGAITSSRGFGIGELSRRTGTAIANIHYYESIDLLPRAGRNGGGERSYDEAGVNGVWQPFIQFELASWRGEVSDTGMKVQAEITSL